MRTIREPLDAYLMDGGHRSRWRPVLEITVGVHSRILKSAIIRQEPADDSRPCERAAG